MLSNILRVILSRALFHETMKERERLEKEIKEKREAISKGNLSLDEQMEAIQERRKYRAQKTTEEEKAQRLC